MGEPTSRIVVEGVGKRFDLHQAGTRSFRDLLGFRRSHEAKPETSFWALEDVSFQVEPGHPLAIIGHNGSGKSTLLKLLTGILRPTKGKIAIHGRIGALIEVGAGFHPDLTGRENVYLNGSILGASRREMDARFDRIVNFAGMERFIDTPVKRYSTGMYMRLGFSIAAHLDPDILLIDEVLAVGDAQFQNRCLTYLKDYVRRGGSVVFVSHAMGHVRELCDRCVWLDRGKMMGFGDADPLIKSYESLVATREDAEFSRLYPEEWERRERERERQERLATLLARRDRSRLERAEKRRREREERLRVEAERRAALSAQERAEEERRRTELSLLLQYETEWRRREDSRLAADLKREQEQKRIADPTRFRILGAELLRADGTNATELKVGQEAILQVRYRAGRPLATPVIGVDFLRVPDDMHLFTVSNFDHQSVIPTPGEGIVELRIAAMNFGQARYRVRLASYSESGSPEWFHRPEDVVDDALVFEVDAGRFANGCAYLETKWETTLV